MTSRLADITKVDRSRPGWGRVVAAIIACLLLAAAQSHAELPATQNQGATRFGISYLVPTSLTRVSAAPLNAPARVDQVDSVYRDAAGSLQLWVVSSADEGEWQAQATEEQRRAYAAGFAQGLGASGDGTSFRSTADDREHGGRLSELQLSGPSLARSLLSEPSQGAAWGSVRAAGTDERLLACLLRALLDGAPSASVEQLHSRYGSAADSCKTTTERVARFVVAAGPSSFAAKPLAMWSYVLPTRSATVAFYAVSAAERAGDARALIDIVRSSLEIPEGQRASTGLFQLLRLVGIGLGAALAVVIFGVGGARLSMRWRGVTATTGLLGSIVALHVVNGALIAFAADGGAEHYVKLGAALVWSLLLYVPLLAHLEGRTRRPWLGQSGLSTLEYAIVFVTVIAGALLAWSKLGGSLQQHVDKGTERFDDMLGVNGLDPVGAPPPPVVAVRPRPAMSAPAPSPSARAVPPLATQPTVPATPSTPSVSPPPPPPAPIAAAPPRGMLDSVRDYVRNTRGAQYALGLGAGILQGFTPGGFIAPSPYASSKPFELGRGLGQMAAGISETVSGIGMVGGGTLLTGGGAAVAATPGSPAGIGMIAIGVPTIVAGAVTTGNGVASTVSGYGTFIHAMSMSDDPPSGGGGSSSGGGGSSSGGGGGGRPSSEIASDLLKANGGSVTKSLPQLQQMGLGQNKTIEVIQQMYKASGRGSFVQDYAGGAKLLLSRRIGQNQPILVISSTGQVMPGTATIEVTGMLNPAMRAVDVVF